MSSSAETTQPPTQSARSTITDADKTLETKADSAEEVKPTVTDNGEEVKVGGDGKEEEEEEEGECGFCLFMKAGGCKDTFVAWENCVEEAEKNKADIVEKCFEVTGALKKCMEAHADYYEPILRAEKVAEEEAAKELEKEKAAEESKEQKNVEPQDSKGSGNVGGN